MLICLLISRIFLIYLKNMGLSMIGRLKYNTAEPLVPEPYYFEVDIDVEILERYKLTVIDQILEELI
jgi:hypothetical protein